MNVRQIRNAPHGPQFRRAVFLGQLRLELKAAVEMLLDSPLALADNHQDIRDPRRDRLLHHILDHRRIDDRQHFLRLRFRRRKKTRAETRRRDDRLANHTLPRESLTAIFGLITCTSNLRSRLRSCLNIVSSL